MDISTAYHEQLNIRLNNPAESNISGTSLKPGSEADLPVFKQTQAEPKIMMNLEEMTDFLFMIIGAKLRIEPDLKNTGKQINRLA